MSKKNKPKRNVNVFSKVILENFRGYKNKTSVNLGKRLTLFFGKGSVGKSTVLDAITCLHDSQQTNNELEGIAVEHALFKGGKNESFSLGFYASDNEYERGIIKTYQKDKKGDTVLSNISLHSPTDDESDEKFVDFSTSRVQKKFEEDLNLSRYYFAKIKFIENKFAFKELYKETFNGKYIDKLIERLLAVKSWVKTYSNLYKEELSLRKELDALGKELEDNDENVQKIKKELNQIKDKKEDLFNPDSSIQEYSDTFQPFRFIFESESTIDDHVKFLKTKRSYDEFLKYIGDDIRKTKNYLYKNYELSAINQLENKGIRVYNYPDFRKIINSTDSLSEFLTFNVTNLKFANNKNVFARKNFFIWDANNPGKMLTGQEMLSSCAEKFVKVLSSVANVRKVKEAPNLKGPSTVHALIEDNLTSINKWLKKFDYDMKVSVEKAGLTGATEIVHRKFSDKIPSNQGGSGIDYLLNFMPTCLGSQDKIILLEEPEKSLHAKMQVNLAEFFIESSEYNQLVIETHSENLLLGILKSVREGEIDPNDIKINYVYMENGESKIDELKINKKGNFDTKWRHGFFTEKLDLI